MGTGSDPFAALMALNRFGLGARPGDLTAALGDPRGFLAHEVKTADVALTGADLPSSEEALQIVFGVREHRKEERARVASASGAMDESGTRAPKPDAKQPSAQMSDMQQPDAAAEPAMNGAEAAPMAKPAAKPGDNPIRQLYLDEVMARIRKQAQADAGFVERLVAFWANHFAVSTAKGPMVRASAGSFEREAIRPHVLGRFGDMLRAVEQHPAMLFYLDNQRSTGPNSRAGHNRGKGLNENLAREILELHTLGADGGYSQADVTSLARIITGWTFPGPKGRLGEPGRFIFLPNWHEPGAHTLLGKSYPEAGLAQGEAALADLARNPATAKHIATKLVRHFVADLPAPALIERLAGVFRETDGDLAAVSLALIKDDAAWAAPMTKMRNPAEFVTAIIRATGILPAKPQPVLGALTAMGMLPWEPPGPNGFPDTADAWASPEAMKARLEVSWRAAQQAKIAEQPLGVLDAVVGTSASAETSEAIARAESRQQGLAILFMSPEFQRR
jgi:uncharacterized protein (DUF1800 family)